MGHHEMAGRYYHFDGGHPSRSLSVVWAVARQLGQKNPDVDTVVCL